jgi:glucosyl-3-phosphoglycerate synthase
MYAPNPFKPGSSLSHLDEADFGSLLMSPNINPGQAVRQFTGVEIGMLLDLAGRYGPSAIAEVDLGERVHRNRPLAELAGQAEEVLEAVLSRTER